MALSTTISIAISAALTGAPTELSAAASGVSPPIKKTFTWANGTGADQASFVFADTRTLSASATEDLDLAGVLTDGLGATLTFTLVRGLYVAAAAANTNNVLVGGAAATQFLSWVGDATDIVVVRPGGAFLLVAPDATGYVTASGASDFLRIGNSSSGTSVDYDIVLIGA